MSKSPRLIPIKLSGGTNETAIEIPGNISETCLRTHAIVAAIPEVVATMK